MEAAMANFGETLRPDYVLLAVHLPLRRGGRRGPG